MNPSAEGAAQMRRLCFAWGTKLKTAPLISRAFSARLINFPFPRAALPAEAGGSLSPRLSLLAASPLKALLKCPNSRRFAAEIDCVGDLPGDQPRNFIRMFLKNKACSSTNRARAVLKVTTVSWAVSIFPFQR